MARVIAKRQSAVRPRIDPSIFVVLTFAISTVFLFPLGPVCTRGLRPDLFSARHSVLFPKALREDAIQVSIMRDGKILFNSERVTPEQLPGKIRLAIKSGSEQRVYINADKRTKYGNVAEVVDQIHASGVEKVTFLTQGPLYETAVTQR